MKFAERDSLQSTVVTDVTTGFMNYWFYGCGWTSNALNNHANVCRVVSCRVVLCCRQECKKLREELREEHEEDKASALAQLAQSKEQELSNARESWQRKVEDLLEQVGLLPMGVCLHLYCMCVCCLFFSNVKKNKM